MNRAWFGKIWRLPRRVGWRDDVIATAIGAAYAVWLLATARSLGFARDEGFYFHAATDYARWFKLLLEQPSQAVTRGAIDASWSTNHEHPALIKSLFAVSWMVLHEKWKIFDDASTAFRFPTMVLSGVALGVTYLFGARAFSRRAGAIGAALLGLMPQVFYNAHLACFDAPIMTMWLLSIYVYWRAQKERTWGWFLLVGIVYGLTLDTKHNAWILPAVFVPHALFIERHALLRQLRLGRLPLPGALLSMAVLGPLVLVALWPWLWNDTLPRIQEWVNFHTNHDYYNMEFLGKNYYGPPSPPSYAPIMIAATVPAVTLALFGVGAANRIVHGARRLWSWLRIRTGIARWPQPRFRTDRVETDLLLALSFAAPLAVFFLPKTPIFGGTKHWLPAYPFLAMLAGRGFDVVAASLARAAAGWPSAGRRGLQPGLVVFALAAPLAITIHSHPFGLSTYVPLVGGTRGGASLGLNRQFWGFTTQSLAPYFAANASQGAAIFIHDTAWDGWARLVDEGRVRHDLRAVFSPSEADISIVHHELHMNEVDYGIWMAYGTTAPDFVLRQDDVPIVSVYKR